MTKSEKDIEGFHWSRDSKSIAFTAQFPKRKLHKDRKEKYSDYDVFEKDYEQKQLWLVDAAAAEPSCLPAAAKRLTSDTSLNIDSFAWSPDSTRIAFSASKNPLLAFSGEQDIYLLDLAKKNAVKKIVALPGPDGSPVFSPDGKQLAFSTAMAQPYYYYANRHIATVDVENSGRQTCCHAGRCERPDGQLRRRPRTRRLGTRRPLLRRNPKDQHPCVLYRPGVARDSPDYFAGEGSSSKMDRLPAISKQSHSVRRTRHTWLRYTCRPYLRSCRES